MHTSMEHTIQTVIPACDKSTDDILLGYKKNNHNNCGLAEILCKCLHIILKNKIILCNVSVIINMACWELYQISAC